MQAPPSRTWAPLLRQLAKERLGCCAFAHIQQNQARGRSDWFATLISGRRSSGCRGLYSPGQNGKGVVFLLLGIKEV